ncbi:MAG: hypothetical protein FWC40_00355 [Proteobacteria bacterium]|nr:hypothetical protein [Pseudomonadota bacterium]
MKKHLVKLAMVVMASVFPMVAFAGPSLLDEIDAGILDLWTLDASLVEDVSFLGQAMAPRHHPPRRGHGHVVERRVVNVRPRVAPPVVVVHRPTTVVVDTTPVVVAAPAATSSRVERIGSTFGFGLRFVTGKHSPTYFTNGDCIANEKILGLGYYLKVRPSRWVSVEFINDVYAAIDVNDKETWHVPLVLGLRGHVFDYGMLDVYGVGAVAVTFTTTSKSSGIRNEQIQVGGQFGGGVGILLGVLELGVDLRYTIDPPLKNSIHYGFTADSKKPIHGVLFSVNLGLGL